MKMKKKSALLRDCAHPLGGLVGVKIKFKKVVWENVVEKMSLQYPPNSGGYICSPCQWGIPITPQ